MKIQALSEVPEQEYVQILCKLECDKWRLYVNIYFSFTHLKTSMGWNSFCWSIIIFSPPELPDWLSIQFIPIVMWQKKLNVAPCFLEIILETCLFQILWLLQF